MISCTETSTKATLKYEYKYDGTGNRIEQKRTGTGKNETITYSYDSAGRLIAEDSTLSGRTEYEYDSDGNLVGKDGAGQDISYEYTVEDRLKAVRSGGRLLMAASYDGDGNRVLEINLRSENSAGFGPASNKDTLTDENRDAILALDLSAVEQAGALSAWIPKVYNGARYEDTYELTRYVNDVNREHTEVLMEYGSGGSLKTKYTYGTDRLYTQNAAASGARNQTIPGAYMYSGAGSVSEMWSLGTGSRRMMSFSYGPFGETEAQGYSQYSPQPYGGIEESFYAYNGESYSPLTGLQYLRARYYNPGAGRFGSADTYMGSISDPLTRNLYSYAGNDPVNKFDPSGHFSLFKKIGSFISSVRTAAVKVVKIAVAAVKKVVPVVVSYVRKAVPAFVSRVSSAVNSKVIKPAAKWVNNHFVQPVKAGIVNAGAKIYGTAKSFVQNVGASIYTAKNYPKEITQKLIAKVKKFACTTADRIKSSVDWKGIGDYLKKSGKQLLLGNYTDDVTVLGTAAQIATGIVGVDLPADIRDISADLKNWEWSWEHAGQTALDIVGVIPVIGAVKYADEVGTLVKGATKGVDDVAQGVGKNVKSNLGNEIDITPSPNHSTTTKNPGLEGTPNSSVDILDDAGNI